MDPVYSYQAFPSLMRTPVPKMMLALSIPVRYRIFPCWFDVVTTHQPWVPQPAPITTGYISWMNWPSDRCYKAMNMVVLCQRMGNGAGCTHKQNPQLHSRTISSALPWVVAHLKLCDSQGLHRCIWNVVCSHVAFWRGTWGLIIGFYWLSCMFNPAVFGKMLK